MFKLHIRHFQNPYYRAKVAKRLKYLPRQELKITQSECIESDLHVIYIFRIREFASIGYKIHHNYKPPSSYRLLNSYVYVSGGGLKKLAFVSNQKKLKINSQFE